MLAKTGNIETPHKSRTLNQTMFSKQQLNYHYFWDQVLVFTFFLKF